MLQTFDIYRNQKGYINLDKIKKEELSRQTYGSRLNKQWFSIENEEYLFKGNNGELEDIKQILDECLAKILQIDSVESDLAIYHGQKGTISKDFIGKKKYLTMLHLLCEFNSVHNDICTYIEALKARKKDEKEIMFCIKVWMENHLLDIFTCQRDRNIKNIALLEENGILIPAPRYDSAANFLTIVKPNKIKNFMLEKDKNSLIEKYRGVRTKQRITSGDIRENAIDELLKIQFGLQTDIPELLGRELGNTDAFLAELTRVDFNEIYSFLAWHNIKLNELYKEYFKTVFQYKIMEYYSKEEVYRKLKK